MLRTILFDLDGTLLPIDTDQFVRHYMKALADFAGHIVPPKQLIDQLMASTYEMIRNVDPDRTNAEVFAADFFPKIGRTEEELMPVFTRFYEEKYPTLYSVCFGLPGLAREVVRTAVDQGYEIVLATNPLFPRIAIEERMRWIGVADLPWRLVTCYEEMHACKPQPAFYREVLTKIGREPHECMMVGNDVQEDGVAARVGMEVFFITDHLMNRDGAPPAPERADTLAAFLERLKSGRLPSNAGAM